MKQLFTIIMILLVSFAYAQRPAPTALNTFDAEQTRVRIDLKENNQNTLDLDTLYPGNFLDAANYASYVWGEVESEGFIFGINDYGDRGYGQHFPVSAPHEIYGAYYWFGAAAGTTGNVKFKIWEFDGEPGDVLAEIEVPLADIEPSWTLWPDPDYEEGPQPGAFFVDFTDEDGNPVLVSGDFLIGVDVTDLDPFDEDVYELGNISTVIGEGHPDDLAWIWEADDWTQVSVYLDGNLDIGILPTVVAHEDDDTYTVTLNVDMANAVAEGDVEFDPAIHDVWVTGTFADWATPGENADFQMHPLDRASKDEHVLYEEHFSPATEDGLLPEGWEQKKADNAEGNNLQDLEAADTRWWRYSEMFDMGYSDFFPNWIHTEDASMHINWDVEAEQNVYAISPEIELPDAEEITLEFWMYFSSAYHTELDILLEVDGEWKGMAMFNSTQHENLYDEAVHVDLTGNVGTARIAFVYKWTDGIQMNIDAIKVTAATDNGEDPEAHFYTVSFEAEPGDHLYKYFLVEDEPTWDIGEWPGGPDRELHVDGDVEVHDVFGVQPVDKFTVTFEIEDEEGNAIEDAMITFDGQTYDAGQYVIDGVEEGTYEYVVEKDNYNTAEGTVSVDEDKTVKVTLVEDDEVNTPLLDDITLNIFPNPTSDVFYIESDVQISEIRMFDVLGQVVYSHMANDTRHEISVGSIKTGVYFVQLTTEAGIVTERVQVTR